MKWRHFLSRGRALAVGGVLTFFLCILMFAALSDIETRYKSLLSETMYDRNGIPLSITPNSKGHYVIVTTGLPETFVTLLLRKEDRYFYSHPGINPVSTLRALYRYVREGSPGGASTITQQLAKNLLSTELERTFANKLREAVYAVVLEVFKSKNDILLMYANTVYLGNQVQGFETGSHAYFDKPLSSLTHSEQISLLSTLSFPNARNPWKKENAEYAGALHARIAPEMSFVPPQTTTEYSFQHDSYFELRTAGITCDGNCRVSIDDALTREIRAILNRHIDREWERGARNGAVVVIDPETSELLAMVGSRNPESDTSGNQINMALEPRPIGSTVKPFIYLRGFMEGLRPFTLVDDREYKYPIAMGYPLYPKNFDGTYHGVVTLHTALSNSLNVPSVKVLEHIGLTDFYAFLNGLTFRPIQPYDSYQYGIALGGLEMDLLTLSHYFTVFPGKGMLLPLRVRMDGEERYGLPPQSDVTEPLRVSGSEYTELIHAILSDRFAGVEQFGLKSNLNVNAADYGVKTGTSRDFHDSWVVGYTPDFVVGVWLGNAENEPLEQVTGQSGAGAIWHDTVNYLLSTSYNTERSLPRTSIVRLPIDGSEEWGLPGDSIETHRGLLMSDALILLPHEQDVFEFEERMTIPLRASKEVEWTANGRSLGTGTEVLFRPGEAGTYELMAIEPLSKRREIIRIEVNAIR